MKIVQVSPYYYPYTGGSEHFCHELSKRLSNNGHEVHVFTSRLNKNLPKTECIDGVNVHRLLCPYIIGNVNPVTLILKELLSTKADIIHSHSYIFLASNQAAISRKLTGNPPLLLHLHGGIDTPITSNNLISRLLFNFKQKIYDPTLGKWTIEAADIVASVSKRDITLAKERLSNRVTYTQIPNGVAIDEFYKKNNTDDKIRISFIGRLEPWKGIDVFLKTIKKIDTHFDNLEYIIAGDGSLYPRVASTQKMLKNKIRILGQVPHPKIPEILSRTDILLCPSYTEGMPSVCLEALASNVPVVASNVGGIPEIIINGKTGFLTNPGDAKTCAKHASYLISHAEERKQIGNNGRRLTEARYSWNTVVEQVEKTYEIMLSE